MARKGSPQVACDSAAAGAVCMKQERANYYDLTKPVEVFYFYKVASRTISDQKLMQFWEIDEEEI